LNSNVTVDLAAGRERRVGLAPSRVMLCWDVDRRITLVHPKNAERSWRLGWRYAPEIGLAARLGLERLEFCARQNLLLWRETRGRYLAKNVFVEFIALAKAKAGR